MSTEDSLDYGRGAVRRKQIPYSILDLAIIREGRTAFDAIQASRALAIRAEVNGYRRFWMAEHHNMENVASSATAVLLGFIAEATVRIRVGSGGVMLPNHSPLIIAEQFGTLATLYPGRIDLGLGRAPGTDPAAAEVIRPDRFREVHRFPESVRQLQHYLSSENREGAVRAIPGEGTHIPIWILGSSNQSAHIAAELGLPYAFASHFSPQQLIPAIEIYRGGFKPSEQLSEPYVMPCLNVIVAETEARANFLATSLYRLFMGVVTGARRPMPPPSGDLDTLRSAPEWKLVEDMLDGTLVGTKDQVAGQLESFLERTGADEVMISTTIYDEEERYRSIRLFSEIMSKRNGS